MKHHYLPFLIGQLFHAGDENTSVLHCEHISIRDSKFPAFLRCTFRFLALPHPLQTQIFCNGYNPCHRFSPGNIAFCSIPYGNVTVMENILCIVVVFQNRKGKTVNRCI